MTCNEIRQHWMLYLDSEGDSELHLHISDHLGMCPACAEWFAQQQRFEQALTERLAAGTATPELWERVLIRTGLRAPVASRRRWFASGGMLVAATLLLAAGIWAWTTSHSHSSELARLAAFWHEQLLQGDVQPDVVSTSDQEVEDHLKKQVAFPVHCPPRKDVNFALKGAGVCHFKDKLAAYIVGQVGQERVSLLVLDRASLSAFPHERDQIAQGGGRHRCREGNYQMVSGVTRDNVVLVIGAAPPEVLERLFAAYGSYHEG